MYIDQIILRPTVFWVTCAIGRGQDGNRNDAQQARAGSRSQTGGSDRLPDEQRKRPLFLHLSEFSRYQVNKGVSSKQVIEPTHKVQRMIDACRWRFIGDITANTTLEFLSSFTVMA